VEDIYEAIVKPSLKMSLAIAFNELQPRIHGADGNDAELKRWLYGTLGAAAGHVFGGGDARRLHINVLRTASRTCQSLRYLLRHANTVEAIIDETAKRVVEGFVGGFGRRAEPIGVEFRGRRPRRVQLLRTIGYND